MTSPREDSARTSFGVPGYHSLTNAALFDWCSADFSVLQAGADVERCFLPNFSGARYPDGLPDGGESHISFVFAALIRESYAKSASGDSFLLDVRLGSVPDHIDIYGILEPLLAAGNAPLSVWKRGLTGIGSARVRRLPGGTTSRRSSSGQWRYRGKATVLGRPLDDCPDHFWRVRPLSPHNSTLPC